MKTWKPAILILIAIALFFAWIVFRPERLFVDRRINEGFPATEGALAGQTLASGTFHSVAHHTIGTATIYRLGDGSRVIRLTNFRTTNGPDVHVYMVAAEDANDNATVKRAGFIDLGSIKGNIGDQNYEVGPSVDLSKYRAVSIWCKRFSVNFGSAPLMRDHAVSRR